MCFTRRSLLATGAALGAIPFPVWLKTHAAAEYVAPVVRYDVASPQGAAMLAKFASAIEIMSARPAGDPTGWTFQWFTHWVRGDSSKTDEIARLPPGQQALADEMWDTCQGHGSDVEQGYFLPWHRMYIYFLERIVRKTLGDSSFTMPYWNCADPEQRALPEAFRKPVNSSNPLYRSVRNKNVNAGEPLDKDAKGASPLNLDALDQENYSPSDIDPGFCMKMDQGLHACVHVLVGARRDMGSVAWAANDPIFWLHHCNIDRLWMSWNRNGGQNPKGEDWRGKQFVFADENGNRVAAPVRDFSGSDEVGYTYDKLVLSPLTVASAAPPAAAVPAAAPPPTAMAEAQPPGGAPERVGAERHLAGAAPPPRAAPPPKLAGAGGNAVALGAGAVRVALAAPSEFMLAQAPPPETIEGTATGAPAPGGAAPTAGAAPPTAAAAPNRGAVGAKRAPPRAAPPLVPAAPPAGHRLFLVIRNLRAEAEPGVLYDVFVDLPPHASATEAAAHHVGTINFFDAAMRGPGGGPGSGMPGMGASQKFVSFDVTRLFAAPSLAPIAVTIAPAGRPAADAKPVIGDIAFIAR